MARKITSFRVGRVAAYLRGRAWYLCYYEDGRRRRPRVGPDKQAARQLAAQTNAQLELSAPAPLSFEPISCDELRERWLHYHEHVLCSAVATVRRYGTASTYLVKFTNNGQSAKLASHFRPAHAEAFVAYLRGLEVPPNGHPHARKRPLKDKGIKYILEVCRSLFNYAAKRRHLPPYADNPFTAIEIDRIPVEDAKPFVGFDEDQEERFLEACDDWQFPVFLTLLLTGVRPGELTHALLPDDLDLRDGWLMICNKPALGWQVKTRNERRIPLAPESVEVLRVLVGERSTGPVFLRRRFLTGDTTLLAGQSSRRLEAELRRRIAEQVSETGETPSRQDVERRARTVWSDMGAIKTDRIRTEFMRLTKRVGLPDVTAPKTLRHMFATLLQDANVDPLIRNQLMGHAASGTGTAGGGLGMTGVYTHTRPETLRRQLEDALRNRPAVRVARRWLASRVRADA